MNKKISIVIPVYNTGQYFKECVDSIFNQTFTDWEMICVDDASDDEMTKDILRELEQCLRYDITVVYNEKKIGAAQARNIGMDIATGEYIIFLDSDDFFDTNFLNLMYEKIVSEKAEVCVTGCVQFLTNNDKCSIVSQHKMIDDISNFRESENYFSIMRLSPWNKLVKLDFLKNSNIRFQSLYCCNDVYYSAMVLVLAKKIVTVPGSRFIWIRRNRMSQISSNRDSNDLIKAVEQIERNLSERKQSSEIIEKQIAFLLIYGGIYNITNCKNQESNTELYNYVKCRKTSIVCSDKTNCMLNMWLNNDDYMWMNYPGNFEMQLEYSTEILIEKILPYKRIFLWGYGKRGKAFEKWGYINNIAIEAICDSDTEKNIKITEYGNSFINPCKLLNVDNGIIVASNCEIYNSIYEKSKIAVINLENYCPL